MVLRIPQAATSLVMPPPEPQPLTKLTSYAITELISCAEQCEGVQRTLGGLESGVGHVQVETGAAQTRMPEQQLNTAQVDASFEQMRRKRVPS